MRSAIAQLGPPFGDGDPQLVQGFGDRRRVKTFEPLRIFKVDAARIDFHHAGWRGRIEFGRRIAGKDDRRHAAFAGLREDIGSVSEMPKTHLATVFDVAGATTSV